MKRDWLSICGMHDGASPNVFNNAFKLRKRMTEPELKLWKYLKTKPLGFKFRRQHPIAGFILDFYCHKLRLSIEIDGDYHKKIDQRDSDKERTQYLDKLGIKEIRFHNPDILNHFETVLQQIHTELENLSLRPGSNQNPH